MSQKLRAVLYLLIIIICCIAFLFSTYYKNYQKNFPVTESVIFEIEPGDSEYHIFYHLYQKGLINNPNLAYYLFRFSKRFNKDQDFTSGEYEVTKQDNLKSLLKKFINNDIYHHKITIAEGLTSHKIVELINNQPNLTGKITTVPPEGSLFPNTYYYSKDNSREGLIAKMQEKMTETLNELWEKRDDNLQLHNKIDALILASIIEKETGLSGERKKISSVFHNRLNINMRLQSDPTVIYGITLGKFELDRPLSKKDLRTPTPHNTYKIYGLPLTPIANPGYAAIEAALSPADTDYFYFVSDGYGVHKFSKDLNQHNIYVQELRKIEKLQKN